jgi:hypothetical protein
MVKRVAQQYRARNKRDKDKGGDKEIDEIKAVRFAKVQGASFYYKA